MRWLEEYAKIIILFNDDTYMQYDGHDLVNARDYARAEMVIGIRNDGVSRILKNRWGNQT